MIKTINVTVRDCKLGWKAGNSVGLAVSRHLKKKYRALHRRVAIFLDDGQVRCDLKISERSFRSNKPIKFRLDIPVEYLK